MLHFIDNIYLLKSAIVQKNNSVLYLSFTKRLVVIIRLQYTNLTVNKTRKPIKIIERFSILKRNNVFLIISFFHNNVCGELIISLSLDRDWWTKPSRIHTETRQMSHIIRITCEQGFTQQIFT